MAVVARVSQHLTLGCSTGYMGEHRGDWPAMVRAAGSECPLAVELAALSEPELPGLVRYLEGEPALPFRFVSVHGPTKARRIPEVNLVAKLAELPSWIDAVVVHPDCVGEPSLYRLLGPKLVLENMDARKEDGRVVAELEPLFAELPDAGLCFDVAHAWSVDPSMAEGGRILDAFGERLRHVHISSLDADCGHVPLTEEHETLFAPLLDRCRDVPWILEAPPRPA